jgi:hypothetical protein
VQEERLEQAVGPAPEPITEYSFSGKKVQAQVKAKRDMQRTPPIHSEQAWQRLDENLKALQKRELRESAEAMDAARRSGSFTGMMRAEHDALVAKYKHALTLFDILRRHVLRWIADTRADTFTGASRVKEFERINRWTDHVFDLWATCGILVTQRDHAKTDAFFFDNKPRCKTVKKWSKLTDRTEDQARSAWEAMDSPSRRGGGGDGNQGSRAADTRKIADLTSQLATEKAANKKKPTVPAATQGTQEPQGGKPKGGKIRWPYNMTCKQCGVKGHPEGQCSIYVALATQKRKDKHKDAPAMWKKIDLFRKNSKSMQGVPETV